MLADHDRPRRGRRHFLRRVLAGGGSAAALAALSPRPAGAGSAPTLPLAPGDHVPDLGGSSVAGAIQDAIDGAAGAGGGTVLLPAGELDLDGDLVLRSNVTLRGMSWSATILGGSGVVVLVEDGAEGAALEQVTVPGVRFGSSASFALLRRVRVRDAAGDAVVLPPEVAHHLAVEQVTVEGCGGDGIVHRATDARGVFISEVAVTGFGRATEGACGIRVAGRALISQVHVEPVGSGQVGVAFEAGSDLSALTNHTAVLDGGEAVRRTPESLRVAVGPGAEA